MSGQQNQGDATQKIGSFLIKMGQDLQSMFGPGSTPTAPSMYPPSVVQPHAMGGSTSTKLIPKIGGNPGSSQTSGLGHYPVSGFGGYPGSSQISGLGHYPVSGFGGYPGSSQAYGGGDYESLASDLRRHEEITNSQARTQLHLSATISERLNQLTGFAEANLGFKPKGTFISVEKLDPDFNCSGKHSSKNFITNGEPSYTIKTQAGQAAFDDCMLQYKHKRTITEAQKEEMAYTMARTADEEEEENAKRKKPKHAPAGPTRADCLQVLAAMKADQQKADLTTKHPDTIQWAKDLNEIDHTASKLKKTQSKNFLDNVTTFGFLFFLRQTGGNPFIKATNEVKHKFRKFKELHNLSLDDDWDGGEADCNIPAA